MIDVFGWAAILFVAKWAFIAVVYLALFVILFAVRRELTGRLRPAKSTAGPAPGRLRVIAAGSDRSLKPGQTLPLKAEAHLGAESDNDLVLRDQFVSSRHARLYWDGNAWWVEDLGSKNGTRLNQAPCFPHMPVQAPAHSRLAIGDMIFELLES